MPIARTRAQGTRGTRGSHLAPEFARVRRRRANLAVPVYQADRRRRLRPGARVMKQDLLASLRAAVVALLVFTVLTGVVSAARAGHRPSIFPATSERFTNRRPRPRGRQRAHRPGVHAPDVYLESVRDRPLPVQRDVRGSHSHPTRHASRTRRAFTMRSPTGSSCARPIRATRSGARRPSDLVCLGPGIRTSRPRRRVLPSAADRARAQPRSPTSARSSTRTCKSKTFGILGEPRVNVVAVRDQALDARTGPTR